MSLEENPPLELTDSDNSDKYSNDDDEMDYSEPTKCLFCSDTSPSIDLAIIHLKDIHKIDLMFLKTKFKMDQYSYIKLINYIRVNEPNPEIIQNAASVLWNDEKYLKPIKFEPWLSYDFEEISSNHHQIKHELLKNNINSEQYLKMEELVHSLMEKIKEKDNLLEQAAEDIKRMQKVFQRIVEKDPKPTNIKNSVACVSLKADEGYFNSYAHFGIHHEMLSDTVRTETYRNAILNNKGFFSGKHVLDVGCGTAVLSMFASKAGAEKIVAIDNSEIIYDAMDIAKKNNFGNIEFVKGRLEDTELPIDKFDIIVSEWMGYFLLFEGMLDSIIYARDHHLKPNGILMPNRCTISLAGYGDVKRHSELITFWDSVYGFNMSSMKKNVLQEPLIEICKSEFLLTDSDIICDLDLNTIDLNYSNFEYDFKLKTEKDGKLTSFIGYFDTFFDLPNPVSFSTSADHKATHWKQVIFFLEKPITIEKLQIIEGKIVCKRSKNDLRSLDIKIRVFNKEYNYYLD